MVSIRVTSRGFKNNHDLLELFKDIDTSSMLHRLGEDIVQEARSNLQNNTNIDSGTLLASINILDEGSNFITIGSLEPYAGYIEYGRGPVKPKDPNGWLHWIDKDTGKDVFAKFAKATEPSPFLEPAVIKNTKIFSDVYLETTEEMARRKKTSDERQL